MTANKVSVFSLSIKSPFSGSLREAFKMAFISSGMIVTLKVKKRDGNDVNARNGQTFFEIGFRISRYLMSKYVL